MTLHIRKSFAPSSSAHEEEEFTTGELGEVRHFDEFLEVVLPFYFPRTPTTVTAAAAAEQPYISF